MASALEEQEKINRLCEQVTRRIERNQQQHDELDRLPEELLEQVSEPGTKHDAQKLRMDLIPVETLEGLARVLGHGAGRYGDRSWEKGFSWHRAYGAILRHLTAFWDGCEFDEDSGLHPLDHALAELAFLHTFALRARYAEFDDRPELVPEENDALDEERTLS